MRIAGGDATAVQVVSYLAKWSRKLVVSMRTLPSVDVRDGRSVDEGVWKKDVWRFGEGWQGKRWENVNVRGSDLYAGLVER